MLHLCIWSFVSDPIWSNQFALSGQRRAHCAEMLLKFRFRSDLIKSICTFGSTKSSLYRNVLSCRRCRDVTSLHLKFRFRSDLIKSFLHFRVNEELIVQKCFWPRLIPFTGSPTDRRTHEQSIWTNTIPFTPKEFSPQHNNSTLIGWPPKDRVILTMHLTQYDFLPGWFSPKEHQKMSSVMHMT